MSAHLRPLPRCRTCGAPATEALYSTFNAPATEALYSTFNAPATEALYSTFNAPCGEYCNRHAKAALATFVRSAGSYGGATGSTPGGTW